jgi:arylsulfatase A-like enzyme
MRSDPAPSPGDRLRRLLPGALAAAALAGALAGGWTGWADGGNRFPVLLLDALRQAWRWSLPAAAIAALLAAAVCAPLARRWARWGAAAAITLAALPLVALGGYALNRRLGIRPSELAESYALSRNLAYLALCALGITVAVWLGRRALGREPGHARAWLAAALLPWLGLEAALGLWSRTGGGDQRPDVLVLLVDALRADHVGTYVYARPTTPAIDALARDGIVFEQAVSQSTFTKTSIASLFTGLNPYRHGVYRGSQRENPVKVTSDVLPRRLMTVAEVLRDHGYLTAAWVQNSHLRGFMGFAQGFVAYRDQQGPVERISRRVEHFLALAGRRLPFFVYAHFIDLHDPYRPPPPYDAMFGAPAGADAAYAGVDLAEWGAYLADLREGKRRLEPAQVARLEALYDGQLRRLDDRVGLLLARLKRLGLYDSTLIVLTSDHGDGFLEHGFISHSTTPYEELVRVPLIVKLPAGRAAGSRVAPQVRLIDVMPTVLDASGVREELPLDGCSLLPLLRPAAEQPVECAVAVVEIAEDGDTPTVALRTARAKFIRRAGKPDELYDLAADPRETRNLAGTGLAEEVVFARLAADIAQRRRQAVSEQVTLDQRLIRELKALGYLK